jgi:hypothetical protein
VTSTAVILALVARIWHDFRAGALDDFEISVKVDPRHKGEDDGQGSAPVLETRTIRLAGTNSILEAFFIACEWA